MNPGPNHYFPSIRQSWKAASSTRFFTLRFLLSLGYLVALILFLNYFFAWVQRRDGVVLSDPLLALLKPVNFSRYIFVLLYIAVLTGAVYLLRHPLLLLRVLQTVAIVYSLRVIAMYFVPLDPPPGIIPLTDNFLQHLTYGGVVITKDLFFSGHTTSLLILALATRNKWLKIFFSCLLIAVVIMLLWQHVHYTIDILGAFVFTPLCWYLSKYLNGGKIRQ